MFHKELTSTNLYLRWFKKLFGILQISLDEEGHHSTKPCHLSLSKLMLRKRLQTWKQDALFIFSVNLMTTVNPLLNGPPNEVASNQSLHDSFSIVFTFIK